MRTRTFDHAAARQLRAEGWKLKDIANRFGVTSTTIGAACRDVICPVNHHHGNNNLAGYHATRRAAVYDKKDEVVRLRKCGHSLSNIASKVKLSRKTVYDLCRSIEKGSISMRLMKDVVEIPSWVPSQLHAVYLDVGAKRGEEAAASHCRRLKHGGAAACR